ncbi:MAG TPA: HAMP domain-containing protein [Candidatus Methanofastidiosum sp.]|nr:HAMP domain-containing protein [Methanofastidiosum sp.]
MVSIPFLRRIRNKFIATYLIVLLVPVMAIGFYSINFTIDYLENDALKVVEQQAEITAKEIEKSLGVAESDIDFLSQSASLRALADAKNRKSVIEYIIYRERLTEEFYNFANSKKAYSSVVYIDESGKEVVKIVYNWNQTFIATTSALYDVSDEEYFLKTMTLDKGQLYVSSLDLTSTITTESGDLIVSYAKPVFDSNGIKRGIVLISFPAQRVLSPILELSARSNLNTFILNKQGYYISKVGTSSLSNPYYAGESFIDQYRAEGFLKILSGTSGTISEGTDQIIAYSPVFPSSTDKTNFWIVVVTYSTGTLFEPISVFENSFILIVMSTIIIAVFFGVIMADRITRPLRKLVYASRSLAKGDLNPKIDIDSEDEVGELAKAFGDMSKNLKKSYEDLERKVKERTLELQKANKKLSETNIELVELNKKISEANKLKSQFLANITHELRTPLTSIIGFSEVVLNEAKLNEEQADYLETILRNGEILLKLINDILELSRLDAGKSKLYLTEFNLQDAINKTLKIVSPLSKDKNIWISLNVKDVENVVADEDKIIEVLLNLLTNAIKFNVEEGKIAVRAFKIDDHVRVEIEDTGIGIKKEELDIIFDEFRQIDSSETKAYSGTGLGLSISKHYVELHGGLIWAESEPGKGSIFIFEIPIEAEEEE